MKTMIKLEQLENLKLIVDETVYLSEQETLDRLELAVQQGTGGWGVRRDDGALLKLARDLKLALGMAEQQDETYRKLKGVQMENGRLKKQLSNVEGQLEAAMNQLKAAEDKDEAFNNNLSIVNEQAVEIDELKKQLAGVLGTDIPSNDDV
jgi:hypothetical protein